MTFHASNDGDTWWARAIHAHQKGVRSPERGYAHSFHFQAKAFFRGFVPDAAILTPTRLRARPLTRSCGAGISRHKPLRLRLRFLFHDPRLALTGCTPPRYGDKCSAIRNEAPHRTHPVCTTQSNAVGKQERKLQPWASEQYSSPEKTTTSPPPPSNGQAISTRS